MSATVLIALLLLSALVHATFHSIVKIAADRFVTYSLINAFAGLIAAAYLAVMGGWINPAAYPWLAASIGLHLVYKVLLIQAYKAPQFSVIFPITRGLSPILVLILGYWWLDKGISNTAAIWVLGVGLCICALAWPALQRQQVRGVDLRFALGTAAITAAYSLVDGMGGRLSGAPVAFIMWMYVADALVFPPLAFWQYRGKGVQAFSPYCKPALWAALLSMTSYAVVVYAMAHLPIAVVAAVREANIVFAALIGWLVFKEHFTPTKWALIVAISGCVAMVALSR